VLCKTVTIDIHQNQVKEGKREKKKEREIICIFRLGNTEVFYTWQKEISEAYKYYKTKPNIL
jgi:hypothetical protein